MALLDRISKLWNAFARQWSKFHVERHGSYSIERLYNFKRYCERTSWVRVVLVLILTPLPCLAVTTATDLIPLEPTEKGLGHSYRFWIRTGCVGWYISFVFMHQCRDFITQIPMRLVHMVLVATFVSVSSVVTTIGLSDATGWFPLPFYQILSIPGWLVSLAIGIFMAWGRYFRGNQFVQRQFIRYTLIVSAQVSKTLVYPGYIFVFKQFTGGAQVAFACLLPMLKLLTKNVINLLLPDVEDGKPEFIIFNVEIFHALYVACCTQNATSYHTAIVLTAIDFLFAIKSLVDIWASVQDAERTILSQPRESTEGTDAIAAPTQPRNLKLQLSEVTIHLVETYPALLQHDSIRMRSQALQRHLQSRIYPNALPRPLESAGRARASARKPGDANRISPRLPSKKQIETQQPEPTSSVTSHLQPQLRRVGSSWMAETESNLISSNLMQEGKQTVAALSDAQRLKFVQQILRILYWTEFVLLVEFTEVAIPIIYCAYLGIAFRLPNRVYYSQLRDIDETTLNTNIETALVYATLQARSLVLMIVLLHFKLRISVVRQLTFVLESQWQQVQAKLVLWLVFSIQATLEHFGEDFSFQFAWLRKS